MDANSALDLKGACRNDHSWSKKEREGSMFIGREGKGKVGMLDLKLEL